MQSQLFLLHQSIYQQMMRRIYPIADKYKINLIKYPEEVSADNSSMEAVIYNFLNSINFNCNILLLQPTNPFRLPETTKEFFKSRN